MALKDAMVAELKKEGESTKKILQRGQLSVYLRMLDVSVPGMYGPSADER
jgi:hypothetical protein